MMRFLKMLGSRPICRRWPTSDISFSQFQTTSTISPPKQLLLSRFLKFGSLSVSRFAEYTGDELDKMTISFRARYTRCDHPYVLAYYKRYRDSIARVQNIEFKSFWESTNRDEHPHILGYVNSLIANAKAVCAEAIDWYLNYSFRIENTIKDDFEPPPDKLLPDIINPLLQRRLTLVLDMNETLFHSDWMEEGITRDEHSFKRPGLDAFLDRLKRRCELVIYTDVRHLDAFYILMNLEKLGGFQHIFSRRHNTYQDGKRYRDLSKLNRDPSKVLYVSGHALENCLQPENCLPIKPWKKEMDDNTLMDILPFIEYVINERPDDIRPILASFKGKDVAAECKKYERRMQELEERRMEEGDV